MPRMRRPRVDDLGSRIARARKRAGVSRQELAGLLGIDTSVLGRIERGHVSVNADRLVLIARLLGVSAAFLLGEIEAEESKAS
jgi:transcriptional regulator with XRE-family HTH domain